MKKKLKVNISLLLILFAIVPLLIGGIINTASLVSASYNSLEKSTHNSLTAVTTEANGVLTNYIKNSEETVRTFTSAPVVKEFLKNPNDKALADKAQQYTLDYFGQLDNWEGIYIADWNSKVLTHPAPPVIGKVMREGDRLEELRNAMTEAGDIYDVGIITSPASGQLILSMYAPVYGDNGKPLGYVGAGTYISNIALTIADVSALGYSSAYMYIVDGLTGTMLYHPTEEKIGQPVENEVVKGLVAQLEAGNIPAPDVIQYKFKGEDKYAAYYINEQTKCIMVIAADKKEVMKSINSMKTMSIIIDIVLVAIVGVLSVIVAKSVSKPLEQVTKTIEKTANGELDNDLSKINTALDETRSLIDSAKLLQTKLLEVVGQTKNISTNLTDGAAHILELTDLSREATDQISNAVEDLAQGSSTMANEVQTINEQVISIGNSVDEISFTTDSLVQLSTNIKTANAEATDYIRKVYDSSHQSADAIVTIQSQIAETNSAIKEIQNAVEMIQSVASQTNLLALNASIEAARAGEAGRGFAVVASEIGNLSTQSNESANQIDMIVRNIITQSDKLVGLSQSVSQLITEEQGCINETQEKFRVLNTNIEDSLAQIDAISLKVDSLSSAKDVIIDSVNDLSALSEENAASTEQVSASVTTIARDVSNISDSSKDTNNLVTSLNEAMTYFK